jgi:predicted SnoaL-like aldol condensation-catalyzing enzyme
VYAEFVERFQAAWAASDLEQHQVLWTDDVELHQPILGSLYGREACREAFARMFDMAPDLTVKVDGWSERDGVLTISFTFHTTFGGSPVTWPAVDAFRLDGDGRVLRRDSFWDPLPVLVHLLRHPSAWPRALRTRMIPRLQDRDVARRPIWTFARARS